MNNKLISIAITLVVGIILAGSVLMPVINDARDHSVKYTNAAGGDNYIFADEVATITYDGTTYSINGEAITPLNGNYATITSDAFTIRWASGVPTIVIFGETWSSLAPTEFNLTANNGTLSGTYSDTQDTDEPISLTYETLYYQDPDGSYAMMGGTQTFYMQENTEWLVTGFNSNLGTSGTPRFFKLTGTIADGFTLLVGGTTTYTEYTLNAEKIEGVKDMYLVTSLEFVITEEFTLTINRLIVPTTLETEETGTEQFDSLLMVIPVLVIVALLMVAIGAIVKRND